MDLIREMGFFAKLGMAIGVGTFVLALTYLVRPTERRLAFMKPVSLASIFGAVSSFAMGGAMVLKGVAATPPAQLDMARVYMGMSETFVPVFVTFGLLAGAWLLVAAGMLRRS